MKHKKWGINSHIEILDASSLKHHEGSWGGEGLVVIFNNHHIKTIVFF